MMCNPIAARLGFAYVRAMALLNIIIHPDPRLKTRADLVESFDAGLRKLADDMLETMYDAPGIGLAAPQIGVLRRLIVVDCIKNDDEPPRPIAMVNPAVTWASAITSVYEEGCLSIPEQYAEVERPSEVDVAWCDVTGASHSERFGGLWATCVQHEIDHLNGRLFIDYLSGLKRQVITRKMQKLKRERARA